MAKEVKLIGLVSAAVLSVTEEVSALKCIRLMRERKISSLVVLDEPTGQSLVGIVTERDIVLNFEKLVKDCTVPVRRIMTSEVITLPVGQLNRAGELMLQRGFRHVVFTYKGEGARRKVAGIASMRDLLRENVRGAGTRLSPYAEMVRAVALVSDSDDSRSLFKSLFRQIEQSTFENYSVREFSSFKKIADLDAVFVDIDHAPTAAWAILIQKILDLGHRPKSVIVLFTPSAYSQKTLQFLSQLSKSKSLKFVEKPINLGSIIDLLRR